MYENLCKKLEQELSVEKNHKKEIDRRMNHVEEEEKSRLLEREINELKGLHLAL
jgi:hypothetical protein